MAKSKKKESIWSREINIGRKKENTEEQSGVSNDSSAGAKSSGRISKAEKAKRIDVPTKTTINLLVENKKKVPKQRKILIAVLIIAVVALVGKFGVLDRYQHVKQLEAQVVELQTELDECEAYTENYDEVYNTYSHHADEYLTDEEAALVDRNDALKLIENEIMPEAKLARVALTDNTFEMTISNISLKKLSALVEELQEMDEVLYVAVYEANTDFEQVTLDDADGSQKITVTMSITLKEVE